VHFRRKKGKKKHLRGGCSTKMWKRTKFKFPTHAHGKNRHHQREGTRTVFVKKGPGDNPSVRQEVRSNWSGWRPRTAEKCYPNKSTGLWKTNDGTFDPVNLMKMTTVEK